MPHTEVRTLLNELFTGGFVHQQEIQTRQGTPICTYYVDMAEATHLVRNTVTLTLRNMLLRMEREKEEF